MRFHRYFRKGGLAFRGIALITLLAVGPGSMLAAVLQDKQDKKDSSDTKKKDSRKKEELKSVYKKWLEEDVSYIITDEERRAFKSLKTDEERDSFIEQFWLRRDPDPDTPENEYKDQYYERVEYANEHFASGIPGWKTDRGRIYITFGKPDEIEAHPAGGPYERPSYQGGGSTSTYPFEDWWYRYIEGVGSDIEIEFVDPSGSGEYRIARNPDEKDALLYVPGAGMTLAESLGLADKSSRVAGAMGFGSTTSGQGNIFGSRAQDQEFEVLQKLYLLQKPPPIKFADLEVKADLPEVAGDVLPFSVRTDFMRISTDAVVTSFTMQFEHSDISFKNQGGVYTGTVNIYAKIISLSGKRRTPFEDIVTTARYTQEQLPVAQTQKSLYQKNVVLDPGRYKIDIVARDIVSGKTGILHHSFEVPRYKEKTLATSTLILASSITALDGKSIHSGPFVLGTYKVEPYVSGVYKPNQNLAIFLQVYDAEMDQTTLQPALKVEYIIKKGDTEVAHFVEDGKSRDGFVDLKGQQLTVVRRIPLTANLGEPGSYTLTAKITDMVSQKEVTPRASFTVVNK